MHMLMRLQDWGCTGSVLPMWLQSFTWRCVSFWTPPCATCVGTCVCPASSAVPTVPVNAWLGNEPPGSRVCPQPFQEKQTRILANQTPRCKKMDIFNWCLVLEGDTIKNKPNVIVQRCLCVGEKCQSSPPPSSLFFSGLICKNMRPWEPLLFYLVPGERKRDLTVPSR